MNSAFETVIARKVGTTTTGNLMQLFDVVPALLKRSPSQPSCDCNQSNRTNCIKRTNDVASSLQLEENVKHHHKS
ncbi:MAG: hypothetical protein ACRC8A_18930 [Microcoleaceae cyanobacterium]